MTRLTNFNHKFDIAGQFLLSHHILEGFHMHVKLPFVICCTTRINFSVAYGRLERRGIPKLQGIGRLHIVMSIHQYGGQIGVNQFFASARKIIQNSAL